MTTTLRTDGAPTRTRTELLAFIAELIGSGPWPTVSADDLREIQEALQLRASLTLAVAMAMRDAAVRVAGGGNLDLLRRQGHGDTADAYEAAAIRILALDVEKIVANVTGQAPSIAEQAAFEAAAKAADFNVIRRDNGELFHPIAQRVHQVWRAAVRWTRAQAPATTQRAMPEGFDRDDVEAVVDSLLEDHPKTVNVGGDAGMGDMHIESSTGYAARFIRSVIGQKGGAE